MCLSSCWHWQTLKKRRRKNLVGQRILCSHLLTWRRTVDRLRGRMSPKTGFLLLVLCYLDRKEATGRAFIRSLYVESYWGVVRWDRTVVLCLTMLFLNLKHIRKLAIFWSVENILKMWIVGLEPIWWRLGKQVVWFSSTCAISKHPLQHSPLSFHPSPFPLASLDRARHAWYVWILPRLRPW